MASTLPVCLRSSGNDSRKRKAAAKIATPIKRSTAKIPLQSVIPNNNPPAIGATIGANPCTALSMAKKRVNSFPSYRSTAIEREITTPPAAAIPCKRRKQINVITSRHNKQISVVTTNTVKDKINGRRRPYLSLNGPITSCPAAKPITPKVKLSCIREVVVPKYSINSGKAGRYKSVINGPNADNNAANTRTNLLELYFLFSIFLLFLML